MIKANELRIGNWLSRLDGSFFQVSTHDFVIIGKLYQRLTPKPIPLTPEILEKAGWLWNEECNSFEKYPNGDARMNLQKKYNGSYTMFNYVIKALIAENIWHLHQLQNLYFALTGEELEINL